MQIFLERQSATNTPEMELEKNPLETAASTVLASDEGRTEHPAIPLHLLTYPSIHHQSLTGCFPPQRYDSGWQSQFYVDAHYKKYRGDVADYCRAYRHRHSSASRLVGRMLLKYHVPGSANVVEQRWTRVMVFRWNRLTIAVKELDPSYNLKKNKTTTMTDSMRHFSQDIDVEPHDLTQTCTATESSVISTGKTSLDGYEFQVAPDFGSPIFIEGSRSGSSTHSQGMIPSTFASGPSMLQHNMIGNQVTGIPGSSLHVIYDERWPDFHNHPAMTVPQTSLPLSSAHPAMIQPSISILQRPQPQFPQLLKQTKTQKRSTETGNGSVFTLLVYTDDFRHKTYTS